MRPLVKAFQQSGGRETSAPATFLVQPSPWGVSGNIQECLLTQTSLKTTSAEMSRGASHRIPNPIRLKKNLTITSLPLGAKGTQLVAVGLEALQGCRSCRSQCLHSRGAGQRSRRTQPSAGPFTLLFLPGCPPALGVVTGGVGLS